MQKGEDICLLTDYRIKVILDATKDSSKSVIEISKKYDIPLSTVYRKVHYLQKQHLLKSIIKISPSGRKYMLYKSKFS
jgi:response regulator of citrate/malate metabolism